MGIWGIVLQSITVVSALAAPIITKVIDNNHQSEMLKQKTILDVRSRILEEFMKALCNCALEPSLDNKKELLIKYGTVNSCADIDFREANILVGSIIERTEPMKEELIIALINEFDRIRKSVLNI